MFEGFFNYLSYRKMYLQKIPVLTNFLVLNSLAFFEKEKERMEGHQQINLYLDNDTAGKKYTQQALEWSKKFVDQSHLYKAHKDLNASLMQQQLSLRKHPVVAQKQWPRLYKGF